MLSITPEERHRDKLLKAFHEWDQPVYSYLAMLNGYEERNEEWLQELFDAEAVAGYFLAEIPPEDLETDFNGYDGAWPEGHKGRVLSELRAAGVNF